MAKLEESKYNVLKYSSEVLIIFLKLTYPTFNNSHKVSKIISDTRGKDLLLIIDFFDEFLHRFTLDLTLFYQFLTRCFLPNSNLLINRPGTWNQLIRGYTYL